jgi:hypothetical protein
VGRRGDGRPRVEDALRGDHDGGVEKPGLAAFGSLQIGTDAVLAEGANRQRNGVTDGRIELGRETLQLLVRAGVNPHTGAVHAHQHASARPGARPSRG